MITFKNLRLFLVGFFLCASSIFTFSSCSSKKNNDTDNSKIIVWHWMSDRQEAFDELAKRYQLLTGIEVVFELYAPSEVFSQKVRAAAQSNTLPEVFGILSETRDFASFINAGHVANLAPAMEKESNAWKDIFYPKALANNTFEDGNIYNVPKGIYGVPIDVTTIQMVYNKKLLKEAGWTLKTPPQTWEEFVQISKKLKEKNMPSFVSGWGELWLIDCFTSIYAIHTMGEEKYIDTLRGKVPYTDPQWLSVFSLFEQIRDEKILMDGAVTMVNKTAEQTFANERAVFAMNGSWCVNVYSGMNPSLDYGVMLPPRLNDKNPVRVWGGAGSSFVVNAKSEKKDKTIEFLRWLTAKDQQAYLAQATNNLPANMQASDVVAPLLSGFADAMKNSTHPSQWPAQEKPVVAETLLKGIQSILIGEKTAAQLAVEVQKVKEREMASK